MKQTAYSQQEKIILILTIIMFSSFFILELVSWGRYVFLIASLLIALLNPYGNAVYLDRYQKHLLVFSVFCFVSAIWAWVPSAAIEGGVTIIEILICFTLVYNYYSKKENIEELLLVLKWSAFIVSIYAIIYYGGFSAISMASRASETRLDNAFSNVNAIGMLAAIGVTLHVNDLYIERRLKISSLFAVPEILIVAATQSRKALIILIAGILLVAVLKTIRKGNGFGGVLRLITICMVLIVLSVVLLKTGIFNGVLDRFAEGDTLFSKNAGTLRQMYKIIGWEHFLEHPVLGIGMGSSGEMIRQAVGKTTYTHDNYIELLSCGGLIGFCIYYSMYYYIAKKLVTLRKNDSRYADICIVLLIMLLIADYGLVSYSSKERYFYLMMLFIEINNLQILLYTREKKQWEM